MAGGEPNGSDWPITVTDVPVCESCRNASQAQMSSRPAASGKQAKGFREPVLTPLGVSVSRFLRRCTHHVRTVYALHPFSARNRFGGRSGLICRQIMSYLAAKQPYNGGKSLPCTGTELHCTEWPGARSQSEKMLRTMANHLSLMHLRSSANNGRARFLPWV